MVWSVTCTKGKDFGIITLGRLVTEKYLVLFQIFCPSSRCQSPTSKNSTIASSYKRRQPTCEGTPKKKFATSTPNHNRQSLTLFFFTLPFPSFHSLGSIFHSVFPSTLVFFFYCSRGTVPSVRLFTTPLSSISATCPQVYIQLHRDRHQPAFYFPSCLFSSLLFVCPHTFNSNSLAFEAPSIQQP